MRVIDIDGKQETRYEHFFGSNLSLATKLRSWGESGVTKIRIWSTTKIYYRGTLCIMVGYNHGSGADGYRMWHPGTNRVHWTRDTIWLKKVYHETTNQGSKIIYSERNVINIKAEEAIGNKIGTE